MERWKGRRVEGYLSPRRWAKTLFRVALRCVVLLCCAALCLDVLCGAVLSRAGASASASQAHDGGVFDRTPRWMRAAGAAWRRAGVRVRREVLGEPVCEKRARGDTRRQSDGARQGKVTKAFAPSSNATRQHAKGKPQQEARACVRACVRCVRASVCVLFLCVATRRGDQQQIDQGMSYSTVVQYNPYDSPTHPNYPLTHSCLHAAPRMRAIQYRAVL